MALEPTELRRIRKGQILETALRNGPLPIKKLIGIYSLKWGLKSETIRQMILELRDAEVLRVDEGLVMGPSKTEEEVKEDES